VLPEPAAQAALLQPASASRSSSEAIHTADATADAAGATRITAPTALAASDGSNSSGDGSSSSSSSSVLISVLPGDVVWVSTKGCPPWPALVTTSEEATDFSIPHGQTRMPQVRARQSS
jgi:hypothetical protein